METGLITANSPADTDWRGWRKYTAVTAVIDSFNANRTSIRLNFVDISEHSGIGGSVSAIKRDNPVLDPEIYKKTFLKIRETIFIREGIK